MTQYVYYVRYSVYSKRRISLEAMPEGFGLFQDKDAVVCLSNRAYEYLLSKRIRSVEELEEIVDDIRVQDKIDDDNDVVIDFFKLLRIEKNEDPKEEKDVFDHTTTES